MDENDYEEIISTLAKHGRPDLIASFKECVKRDPDYKPSAKEKREYAKQEGEYSDGSVEDEVIAGHVDAEGFYMITDSIPDDSD